MRCMLKKSINSISYFVAGVFFIVIGFFSIFASDKLMKYVLIALAVGIFVNALLHFFIHLFKAENKFNLLFRTLIDLFFSAFLFYRVEFLKKWIIVLFGIYLLCHAICHLVNFIIYHKNHVPGKLKVLLNFIVIFVLSMFLILQPHQNLKYAGIIIGIYFLFYGFMNLNDFICEIIPQKYSNKFKSKIRFPLPIFLTFLIPQQLINLINETLEVKKDTSILYVTKEEKSADLFVLIHLARSGTATFGHVEIAFENKIYSYGNYDRHSRKWLNGIGDGVIAVAQKEDYINYQVFRKNRYLVEFGLKLTEAQKEKVRERIQKLVTENTVPYYSDLQLAEMGIIEMADFHDMSSELYKLADAEYHKVTKGKLKTFYVLKTNCVVVAEYILRSLGTFVPENGIIAPGTYYEYLNGEFMKKNSNVISRKIYTKENSN